MPTDKRLEQFAGNADPDLAALLFQFGRYLMISGSRPGGQPLNLQGIWNKDTIPAWNCGYTININTEMNYWPAELTNLSEPWTWPLSGKLLPARSPLRKCSIWMNRFAMN